MPGPTTSYIAIRLSTDGLAIVEQVYQQTVVQREPRPLRPALASGLVALDERGGEFASDWVGAFTLTILPFFFPVCARYAFTPPEAHVANLTRARDEINLGTIEPPPTRPAHLRLSASAERLLVTRELPTSATPAAALSLAALALSGPCAAARQVGRAVLDNLAALHPELLAAYPALYAN